MPEVFAAIAGILISRVLPALITSSIARKRGINPLIGFGIGIWLGWFGLIGFSILAPRNQSRSHHYERSRSRRNPPRVSNELNVAHSDLWRSEMELSRAEEAMERAEAERDEHSELLEEREQELQRVKDELDAANARAIAQASAARDPWNDNDPQYANAAFPDALPPDLPRTRFDESDEPKRMESGAED